jgi:YHS domain-containing protein
MAGLLPARRAASDTAPPDDAYSPLVEAVDEAGGLEGLGPVCLVDVDPATARHRMEHRGLNIVFCAPSCEEALPADPAASLVG